MSITNLVAESRFIPDMGTKSRQVLELIYHGIRRSDLVVAVPNYHGSPLEDLEGERYGFWLVVRYKDESGVSCLRLNYRHLSGDMALDEEARVIRRKERSKACLDKNRSECQRTPIVFAEHLEATKHYFLSLGEPANDSDYKKPTEI